jgi:predicted ester cyclase
MGIVENRALIRRLHEEGFKGELDKLDQYFAPGFTSHLPFKNLAGLKQTLKMLRETFNSIDIKIEDMVAENEKVCVRCSVIIKTATRQPRVAQTMAIYAIRNGRIVEQWGHGDPLV